MSTTTATASFQTKPLTPSVRVILLLVALAAVAASFVTGHSIAGGTTQVVHRVLVPVSAPASQADPKSCEYDRVGLAC